MAILTLGNTILLRSLWTGGFVDQAMKLKVGTKLVVRILTTIV